MIVRRASPSDAAALADLASRIFYDTFADSNTPEDMAAFLSNAYSEERQRAEIEDPSMVTLLIEVDGTLAGYAQVRRSEPPPCVSGADPVEIMRFYVEKSFHGRGVAQRLMSEVEAVARELGAKTLWLGVWERNHRAIAFYRRYGFRQVGAVPFTVGSDLQTDLVLERVDFET